MLRLALSIILFYSAANAQIRVVTTTPDIAEVVVAIGGSQVQVQSLLKGKEDPHYAEARPDYILKVNKADIVCSLGLDLEVGWLPKVLSKSGKASIQEGGEGHCVLGRFVDALNVPKGVLDRSLGDVHKDGNPHFNLDPLQLAKAGQEVLAALSRQKPSQKESFEKNYVLFKKQMTDLHAKIQNNIGKVKMMQYHQEFSYFFHTYGIENLGSLEDKPGMPPSAARMAFIAKVAKENKVHALLATPSAPHATLERFSELSGVKVITVPSYVQSSGKASSIEKLQLLLAEATK